MIFISIRREFSCDSKRNNCTVSINPELKSFTPPKDLCNHHCNNCNCITSATIDIKKPKNQIKKLKSIILSTNNNKKIASLNIKQELNDSDSNEPIQTVNTVECSTPKILNDIMQFNDIKETKSINSYFKSNEFVSKNVRSYSPPLPATHRLASMVSNDSHQTGNNESRRSRSSKDQKINKKRKKRRHSYSKDSRSRSKSRYNIYNSIHFHEMENYFCGFFFSIFYRSILRSRSSTRSRSQSRSRYAFFFLLKTLMNA